MSGNRIPEAIREEALKLVRHWYADFGPTLAHEYLAREHGLAFSVETLRQWMIEAGLWQGRSLFSLRDLADNLLPVPGWKYPRVSK